MCCQYTAPVLDRCPVCSIYENDWKLRKDSDDKFEPRVKSFLEHIGQCMHYFALRVLPETKPVKSGDDSSQNLTDGTPTQDQSWPSCSLHVSQHQDGLKETDLKIFPELTYHDKLANAQRMQIWVELEENMDDPNSSNEMMRLDPRYDMIKKKKIIEESEDEATDQVDLDNEDFLFGDLWEPAHKIFREQEPDLAKDYNKLLFGNATAVEGTLSRQFVETGLKKLLEDREKQQVKISFSDHNLEIREQVERLTKFLKWSYPLVKDALNSQPYAALAWSGISLFLLASSELTCWATELLLTLIAPNKQ